MLAYEVNAAGPILVIKVCEDNCQLVAWIHPTVSFLFWHIAASALKISVMDVEILKILPYSIHPYTL